MNTLRRGLIRDLIFNNGSDTLSILEKIAELGVGSAEAALPNHRAKSPDSLEVAITTAQNLHRVAKSKNDSKSYAAAISAWQNVFDISQQRGNIEIELKALYHQTDLSLDFANSGNRARYRNAISYAMTALSIINTTKKDFNLKDDFHAFLGDAYARTGQAKSMFEHYFKAMQSTDEGTNGKALKQLSLYVDNHTGRSYDQMVRDAHQAIGTLSTSERIVVKSRLLQNGIGQYLGTNADGKAAAERVKRYDQVFGFDELGDIKDRIVDGFVNHYVQGMARFYGKNDDLLAALKKKAGRKTLENGNPIIQRVHKVISAYGNR